MRGGKISLFCNTSKGAAAGLSSFEKILNVALNFERERERERWNDSYLLFGEKRKGGKIGIFSR